MKYIKRFTESDTWQTARWYGSRGERGPQGTNRFQMGHKDYDADWDKANKEFAEMEKRRNDPTQFCSYDPKTGRGWTPENLAAYIKDRYGVEVPEEVYSSYDKNRPWDGIEMISDYLHSLKGEEK